MQAIQLKNIHFTYPDQYQEILSGVTLDICDGQKIALIGKNGCGKSTLLKIIMRELQPTSGSISYPVSIPTIGYLPQDLMFTDKITVRDFLLQGNPDCYQLIQEINNLSAENNLGIEDGLHLAELWQNYDHSNVLFWEQTVDDVIREMDLNLLANQSCNTLSAGETTRVQLASLLLQNPDILILDEPTNHLDLKELIWLENWLNEYPKAILYVSHDRVFIDHTASKIIELEKGKVLIRTGNYQSFTKDKQELQEHQLKQFTQRKKLIGKLQEAAQKRHNWANSFQKETRPEGGGFKYESIFNAARTMNQQAKHIEERIFMLQNRFPVEKPVIDKTRKIMFSPATGQQKELLSLKDIDFTYAEKQVLHNLYFYLWGGEKIWLAGANGKGKTTLLKIITGELKPAKGTVSYANFLSFGVYNQNLNTLPENLTILEYLKQFSTSEIEIRNFMGCLGLTGDIAYQKMEVLSWGEKAKVQLTALLCGEYNLLLLDEPTNHLDIKTREMLEKALNQYPGAVIFVSHDRAFIQNLATRKFELR
ncbi:MAG TPA: ABC-F family ATP-binding cassette domain-containing protein [Candidatus Cloacimonas sp.]|nr:ABC-F family ATP-binding cassette domain-containing protein [Candidatus Cloacimonas sp.]